MNVNLSYHLLPRINADLFLLFQVGVVSDYDLLALDSISGSLYDDYETEFELLGLIWCFSLLSVFL